jgi:hypothetical protein
MARLIPKVAIEEISVKPERDVAQALVDQLPDECLIYHSYPWLKPDRNDKTGKVTLREGETDFVIILPSHGMLIVEVKGGEVFYDGKKSKWFRRIETWNKEITDPFYQARRNRHYLKDRILELGYPGAQSTPFAHGYAVIFPDCEYKGPTPPGADAAMILSAADLPHLSKKIPTVLSKWSARARLSSLDEETIEIIQRAITPSFRLLPVLFRQVEDQEERLVRMTDEQLRLLEFLGGRSRAAIEGVAGSGKTLLALAQTQRFAGKDKKVLLICYNKTLAEWLRGRIPERFSSHVTVMHFHGLCSEWCKKAGIEFVPKTKDQEKFWKEDAADLLFDAISSLGETFDALIVDEGQDFSPNWWIPLEAINSSGDDGAMYVFYDPAQNLYLEHGPSMPDLGEPFPLPVNCRNTKKIAATCGEIIGREVVTREDAPDGVETTYVDVSGREEEREAIKRILEEWTKGGRLAFSQVAILSPYKYRNSVVAGIRGASIPLTEILPDWRDNRSVLFSTIRSFKGLEADAVLMVDVGKVDSSPLFTTNDFYVGCSRAKHVLSVIRTV